jgi:nitrogen-specific signal transduction histidine kinase
MPISRPGWAGMGLAVAHGILMEHRALVDVTSVEGQGSTFAVMMPIENEGEIEK